MGEREQRYRHWVCGELPARGERLSEEQKTTLIEAILEIQCEFSPPELKAFVSPTPSRDSLEHQSAELKIKRYFNGPLPLPAQSTEEKKETREKRNRFFWFFREVTTDIFSEGEVKELESLFSPGEEHLIVRDMVGLENPLFKKIRDTYWPEMTDVVEISLENIKKS